MNLTELDDYNRMVIEEFRANGGKVNRESLSPVPMLLLTVTGAKTGRLRTVPMMYVPDGERFIVFGSKAGSATNPDWYHNLVAHPEVTVEIGPDSFPATAVITYGDERDAIYARSVERYPVIAEYQAKTTRPFPVIALERRDR